MAQIDKPSLYFNGKTWTGTGASNSLTGIGFRPDWVWIKHREDVSNHRLFDSTRGANKNLKSNDTQAEITATDQLMSFDSDGFTVGADASVNGVGAAGVMAWCWKANAGTTSTDSNGSISSTVQADTTAGFSISTYTGTGSAGTIGHGLGSTPKMMLVKCRSNADTWAVYHADVGATKYLELDTTAAAQTSTQPWNDTAPTSSVFTVGNWSATNGSGRTYVAYCFAEKKGYSKFGSYIGNGNADGTFVYTGFKPAMVLVKRSSSASGQYWELKDNKRDTDNAVTQKLSPNATDAEASISGEEWDFLSNGFKIRTTGAGSNASGVTCIYMAIAENPIVGSNNIPAVAR